MAGQNHYQRWSSYPTQPTPVAFIRVDRPPPPAYCGTPYVVNYTTNDGHCRPNYNRVPTVLPARTPRQQPSLPTYYYTTPNVINGSVDTKTYQITRDDTLRPNGNPNFTYNNGNRRATNDAWRKTRNENATEGYVPERTRSSAAASVALKAEPTRREMTEEITCDMKNMRVGRNDTVRRDEDKTDNVYAYWKKRHSLFSRFQDGIMLDRESFYSVCPEAISRHIADGCAFDVGIDPFCGAGGNVIQLAMVCKSVVAMDVDPLKIELARRNAELYGVAHKITFVVGDFFAVGRTMRADVLVTSPPWGGPNYARKRVFPLSDLCSGDGGARNIMRIARTIAPRVVLHLPKTASKEECVRLGEGFVKIKIEDCHLDGRLNCLTAYYSSFAKWHVPQKINEREFADWRTRGGPQVVHKEVRLFSKRDETVSNGGPDDFTKYRLYMDAVKTFLTQNRQNSDGRKVDDQTAFTAPISNVVPVRQKATHCGSTYHPTNDDGKHDTKCVAKRREVDRRVEGTTTTPNAKLQYEAYEQPVRIDRTSYNSRRYKNNATDRNHRREWGGYVR